MELETYQQTVVSPLSWDALYMGLVYKVAEKSKDPRTKIGAVIVKNNTPVSLGYNGFPRGVFDVFERYDNRETKYQYIVHGEHNAVLNCARNGISTIGTTLYSQGIPCHDCAKTIIQAGVSKVVFHLNWPWDDPKWEKSFKVTKTMFCEAEVQLLGIKVSLNCVGHLNGEVVNV